MAVKLEVGFGKKNEEGKVEKVGTVTLNVPENLDEAVQMYGGDVVLDKCLQSIIIDAQGIARKAETADDAQKILDSWVPGVSRQRTASGVSKSALLSKLKGLAPAELEELLKQAGIE